jgi:hypothetical protein
MTRLSLAARNTLAQDPAIRAHVGSDSVWTDGWIFDGNIFARIEGSQTCAIVLTETDPYTTMNAHNRMKFPTLAVDIWADPTRNADGSQRRDDADDKIEVLVDLIDKHLHTVNLSGPGGEFIVWGTAAQVADRTGVTLQGSTRISGPTISDIEDTEGGRMARLTYGVNVVG